MARQLAAILTIPDRTADLARVAVPSLVVHGEQLVVDGMGHDLPRDVWPELTDRIAALVERAEAER